MRAARHFDGCITRFALVGSHGCYVRYPKTHSPTVRAQGRFVMRHDDEFWMNAP